MFAAAGGVVGNGSMPRPPPLLDEICRAASPGAGASTFDLEAALAKARLHARVSGDRRAASVRLGRFEVLRCLGRGGMGSVFEARDTHNGARLALKALHADGDAGSQTRALSRLKREFRSLAEISHPNLVAMYELHLVQGLAFFTMALVEGAPLHEWLRAGRLDEASLCRSLSQMTRALSTIHAAGTVHGDIKPSNVLLAQDGKLTLLDFGVARALAERTASSSSGTARFMAPERTRFAPVAPGWDWYAVGVLLGDWLQDGAGAADAASGTERVRALRRLRRLQRGLVDANPRTRFGAAEIWRALGEPAPPRRALLSADADLFEGRKLELAALQGALERVTDQPVVCVLHGEPGVGKTALAQRALQVARRAGHVVLEGRCHQLETLPYKGFDGVVDDLASLLQRSPELVGPLTAAEAGALTRLFPQLRRVQRLRVAEPGAEDPRLVRRRAFSGLAQVMAAIARQHKLVVFIDDLQWADTDADALLAQLLLGPQRPPMLLIGGVRAGESNPCVTTLEAAAARGPNVRLSLGPLDEAACARLARRLAARVPRGNPALVADAPALDAVPELSDTQVDGLLRESGRNPLLLSALIGAGVVAEPRERAAARSFAMLVRQRLSQLDALAHELLVLSCAAGGPVSVRLLGAASGQAASAWLPVAALRNQLLLRSLSVRGEASVLPHHDRVREAVLSQLPPEALAAYHAKLVRAAIALNSDDVEFLAEHAYRAGMLAEAARYAQLAAARARRAMAFGRARDLYVRALQCLTPERPAPLVIALADAAFAAGDLKTARPLYAEAAAMRTGAERAALAQRAAELCLLAGDAREGLRLLRPLLRQANVPLPDSSLLAGCVGAVSLLRATLASRDGDERDRPGAVDAEPDVGADASFRAGYMLMVLAPIHGASLALWSTARALGRGSRAQRGRALSQLAYVHGLLELTRPAVQDAWLARARELTRHDADAHSYVLLGASLLQFTRADCCAALAQLGAAHAFIARQPVEAHGVIGHLRALEASLCVMSGDFARLDAFVEPAEHEAELHGNPAAATQLRCARAWRALAAGAPAEMAGFARVERARWAGRRLTPLYGLAVWGEGHRLLYCGAQRQALQLMAAEAARFRRAGVANTRPWSVALKFLWGCIQLANSVHVDDAYGRGALRFARGLERESAVWARGCAALLQGGLARRRGALSRAREHYQAAQRWFEQVGMRGLAAAAAFRAAELRGEAEPALAAPWFAGQAIAEPAAWTRMYAP